MTKDMKMERSDAFRIPCTGIISILVLFSPSDPLLFVQYCDLLSNLEQKRSISERNPEHECHVGRPRLFHEVQTIRPHQERRKYRDVQWSDADGRILFPTRLHW